MRARNLENRGLSSDDAQAQVGDYQDAAEDTIDELVNSIDNLEQKIQEMLVPVGGIDPFGDQKSRHSSAVGVDPDNLVRIGA